MTQQPGISRRYDIAKRVVETHQYHLSGGPARSDVETVSEEWTPTTAPDPADPFDGVVLDMTTAHVIVTVLDCLKPATLAKVDGVPLQRFIDFCWAQVTPVK